MAAQVKAYVDYAGLGAYDSLIKKWVNGDPTSPTASSVIYRTVLYDSDNIYFYHKANAQRETEPYDVADVTVPLTGSDVTKALDEIAALVTAVGGSMSTTSPYTVIFPALTTEAKSTLVAAINELDAAIDVLNGDDTTAGSVAKSIKDAIAALDTSADVGVASKTGKAITITGSVKEEDGVIAKGTATDITLADVASTGKAEDVSIDDTAGKITATNVEDALAELADAAADKAVYMVDNGATSDYAKVYSIYQGTGSAAAPVAGEKIGDINIPKDKVVENGSVVTITYDDGKLYDGSTDVTELIKGAGGTATAADAGKYIKLVLQNVTNPLYINVKDLVNIYTGGTNAETTVTIDANNEITVTINAIAATKVTYGANSNVSAELDKIEGDATTAGSIAKAEADAKAYADGLVGGLDTSTDVAIAAYDSDTTAITFTNGIAESNGVIEAGAGDGIVIQPVATADINSLFAASGN